MNTQRVQLSAEATEILMKGGDEAVQLALGIERDKRQAVQQKQQAEEAMAGLEVSLDAQRRINAQLSSDKHQLVNDLSAARMNDQRGRDILTEINTREDIMEAIATRPQIMRAIQIHLGIVQ